MRIGYFLNSFPNLSETFINGEMLQLIRRGVDVRIYAMREGDDLQADGPLRDLMKVCRYVDPAACPRSAKALHHARRFCRRPRRYRQASREAAALGSDQHTWEFRNSAALASRVERDRIDHIHAHYAHDACAHALWVSKLTGVPMTFTTHGFDLFFDPPDHMAALAEQASAVVCVSRYNARFMADEFGIDPDRIIVNHCGIDPDRFSPGAPDQRDPKRVLTVARLHPVKGLDHLLEAYAILHRRGVPFTGRIVGDGPERARLEQRVRELTLDDHVTLLGPARGPDVVDCYRRAALFVLPSLSESMPLVNMEALACGTAVVATRVHGVPELVEDGVTGRLVEPGDAQGLADVAAELLADPSQRERLARAGRERVLDGFTLAGQADGLLTCWRRVAAGLPPSERDEPMATPPAAPLGGAGAEIAHV